MRRITWSTKQVNFKSLKEWKDNPNKEDEFTFSQLGKSIDKFGYANLIVVNTDYTIIGGNHRFKKLQERGFNGFISVRYPSRKLLPKEMKELALRLNQGGENDPDILMRVFDRAELIDAGMKEEFIPVESSGDDKKKKSKQQQQQQENSKVITIAVTPDGYKALCRQCKNLNVVPESTLVKTKKSKESLIELTCAFSPQGWEKFEEMCSRINVSFRDIDKSLEYGLRIEHIIDFYEKNCKFTRESVKEGK